MKRRILYVEDDLDLAMQTCAALKQKDYEVEYSSTLCNIRNIIRRFIPELLALDIEIGSLSCLEELDNIRIDCPKIPILFISSHSDVQTVTESLEKGVRLFIKKPYGNRELLQAIQMLMPKDIDENVTFGDYRLKNGTLFFLDRQINALTPKEQQVLEFLLEHKDYYVSRNELLNTIWSNDIACDSLYNCICHLRTYLSQEGQCLIENNRNKGYKISLQPTL